MDSGKSFWQPEISEDVLKKFQARQNWVQERQAKVGYSYLVGRADRLSSVLVPSALAAAGIFILGQGLYNLYLGRGKADQ